MLRELDARLFHLLYGRESSWLTLVMITFSMLGSGWAMVALAPMLAHARTRRFAGWLTFVLTFTALIVFLLKQIVGRGRPFTLFHGVRAVALDTPTDGSFPSGHAAGSFCFALFVTRVLCDDSPSRPRSAWAVPLSILAALFASMVAISRVVLGYHFPLDVLGGAIVGGLIGALGGVRYRRSRGEQG